MAMRRRKYVTHFQNTSKEAHRITKHRKLFKSAKINPNAITLSDMLI